MDESQQIVLPTPAPGQGAAAEAALRRATTLGGICNSKPNAEFLLLSLAAELGLPLEPLISKPAAVQPATESDLSTLDAATAAVLVGVGD